MNNQRCVYLNSVIANICYESLPYTCILRTEIDLIFTQKIEVKSELWVIIIVIFIKVVVLT